jgi:hypothetical protein
MESLLLEPTESTPDINFDANTGVLKLSGRSIPENASAFYFPVLDWLNEYVANPKEQTSFVFYLEYINSISQKMIVDVMMKAVTLKKAGKAVEVKWMYDEDDEEMQEEGEIYQTKFDLDIQLEAVPDEYGDEDDY